MALRLFALALTLLAACASSSSSRAPDPPPVGGTSTATVTHALPPEVSTGEGRLTKAEVGSVVHSQLRRFLECYQLLLVKGGTQTGVVKVRFVIAPTGKVSEATIAESALHHPRTESCIIDVVHSLEFSQPRSGNVVVTYPLTFQ
jgi:TonB family protein